MQDRGASRAGAHGKEVAQLRLPTGTRGKGHKQTPQRESQERLRLHKSSVVVAMVQGRGRDLAGGPLSSGVQESSGTEASHATKPCGAGRVQRWDAEQLCPETQEKPRSQHSADPHCNRAVQRGT